MRSFTLATLFLAALTVCDSASALTFNIELDQKTLQEMLVEAFPVQQDEAFVTLELSQPQLVLKEGSDRIGVKVMATVTLPMGGSYSGLAYVDGKLRYEEKSNSLYLDQSMVRDLTIQGLPDMAREQVINIANTLARTFLDKQPIYQFKGDAMPTAGVHKQINRIEVKDGKLLVEVSAF